MGLVSIIGGISSKCFAVLGGNCQARTGASSPTEVTKLEVADEVKRFEVAETCCRMHFARG